MDTSSRSTGDSAHGGLDVQQVSESGAYSCLSSVTACRWPERDCRRGDRDAHRLLIHCELLFARSADLDHASSDAPQHSLQAVASPRLLKEAREVILHGRRFNVEAVSDFGVGESFGK